MKICIFGSGSGTLPIEDRHHTSFALEINGRTYWFDAGENCSYTAYLMGVDLLSVADIFISHPHMDHVGGLGNLLWNIRKLSTQTGQAPRFGDVTVYTPCQETFDGLLTLLKNTEGNYKAEYRTLCKKVADGILLQNEDIQVEAHHNYHLGQTEEGWQSFSFRIFAEGKKLIYSGDIHTLDDMAQWLKEDCDALFVETGHHTAEDICKEIREKGYAVKSLYFLHHGRKLINDFEGTLQRCKDIFPAVQLCNDKDEFYLR